MGYLKYPPRSIQGISHSIQGIFHPFNTRINFSTHSSQSVVELDISTLCVCIRKKGYVYTYIGKTHVWNVYVLVFRDPPVCTKS